jgi:hypothetical protein
MLRGAVTVAAALALAVPAAAAPPREGVVVPGRSFGGLALGAPQAAVKAAWGPKFGRCRSCKFPTLYFNFAPFEPAGVGVELRRGRAVALFTVWSPRGWRTDRGVAVGDPAARVTSVYGPLTSVSCGTYQALTLPARRAKTIFYVYEERVWGFGLSEARVPVCR